MATHQILGRSKKLVNILSNAGQIIPYKKLLKADTAIAEKTMKNIDPVTGAVPPANLVPNRRVQFGKDNIDYQKDSAIAGIAHH